MPDGPDRFHFHVVEKGIHAGDPCRYKGAATSASQEEKAAAIASAMELGKDQVVYPLDDKNSGPD